jgi:hypothetical protein
MNEVPAELGPAISASAVTSRIRRIEVGVAARLMEITGIPPEI